MVQRYPYNLYPNLTTGAKITSLDGGGLRLEIPAGPPGRYRLAQLDDYAQRKRSEFPWKPPLRFSLQARACSDIPGTWGFGLWNDPFSMGLLSGAGPLRLPALPNTAWFFFASPPNHLTLRDDLPGQGSLAATFHAPHWPTWKLLISAPLLPLLAIPPLARGLRRLSRRIVQQEAVALDVNAADWHSYSLEWQTSQVHFQVDGMTTLRTNISPHGPLGIVIWIDNQYAAFTADGRLRYGILPSPTALWVEVREIEIKESP